MPLFASANLPTCFSVAPVKDPFSWPNRIELDQRLGQGAAIDGDERLAAPLGAALDRARHQLLADPGLALDEDGNVRFRCPLGEPHRAGHRVRPAHDVAKAELAGVAARRSAQLVLERVDPEGVLDRHLKTLGSDRLDDEIDCARAHRGDDRLDRTVRGLHDGGNGDVALAHAGEDGHAVEIGHHQIEYEEIDRRPVDRLQARQGRLSGVERLDLVAESPRHRLQQAALDGIVVDNEDESGHCSPAGAAHVRPRDAQQSDIRVNAMLMTSRVDAPPAPKRSPAGQRIGPSLSKH